MVGLNTIKFIDLSGNRLDSIPTPFVNPDYRNMPHVGDEGDQFTFHHLQKLDLSFNKISSIFIEDMSEYDQKVCQKRCADSVESRNRLKEGKNSKQSCQKNNYIKNSLGKWRKNDDQCVKLLTERTVLEHSW